MQCAVKDGMPHLVDGISRNFYDEVYELDTYSCNLFQWLYPFLKQNSMVGFELFILQGPIGEMLSVISTAFQDSNLDFADISVNILCASIYGNMDFKRYTLANLGTNRLGSLIAGPRTQRELSSSVVKMKGPSRNSLSKFKTKSDLKFKIALRENKLKTSKVTKRTRDSVALSRIAFQTDLKSRISKLQKNHQKIYNLDEFLYDVNFLVSCYLMIKGKSGNMSPGSTPETCDGLNVEWFHKVVEELKSGKFQFKTTRQVQIHKPNKPGQFRVLSVGSPRDKIIQKALQVILEAI
jgi:hypothetical protein